MCHLSDIAHCPLYIESHTGSGLGCVDDMSAPCRVARGAMNFQSAIYELIARGIVHPGMVAMLNGFSTKH